MSGSGMCDTHSSQQPAQLPHCNHNRIFALTLLRGPKRNTPFLSARVPVQRGSYNG